MALVIDLKPNEKVIIGSSTITNDKQRTRLRIEGNAPILREKDTMTPDEATTVSKKLYLTVQEMYLAHPEQAFDKYDDYFLHLRSIEDIAPQISNFLNDISMQILQGTYYKGLKLVNDLINFEQLGTEPIADENAQEDQFNQTHMEAQLLSQAADQLQELYENWDKTEQNDRESVISYNRKLWMVFFDGVNDPKGKKSAHSNGRNTFTVTTNIINLYNFIYKRSAVIIDKGNKDKLITLIAINRESAKAMRRS